MKFQRTKSDAEGKQRGGLALAIALVLLSAGVTRPAQAGAYDGSLSRTRYIVLTGDINNDGQNDVLMKAVPTMVMVPMDDDFSFPLVVAPASASFALVSTAYGAYTLVTNPDAATIGRAEWKAGTQQVTFYGAEGDLAGSVSIRAASAEQASFVVSMSASSGQLQISSITPPVLNNSPPNQSLPTCD